MISGRSNKGTIRVPIVKPRIPAAGKLLIQVSPSYDLLVAWGAKRPQAKYWLYWLTGGVCLERLDLYESAEGFTFVVISTQQTGRQ
jgi:hypothetical protein